MGRLTFNYEKCTGCRACELACSFHKEGVFAPSKSRIKIVRIDEEGKGFGLKFLYVDYEDTEEG